MEKPLDVLQDLYQKTDLVRSILSLLLDAMTAGCDPWKTPYVVTVSHMAEMVEEIQTELLAATEELFREKRKVQKTDIYGLVPFGEVLLAQKYPKLGNLFASPVRTGRVGNDNMGDFVWNKSRRGRICPQFFYFSLKYAKKTTFLCLRKAVSTIILCFLPKQNHIRFSGFRHSSSGRTKRPSLRMSTSSNQISPPPYSGVMMSTRSQWIADLLPLGASS